MKTTDKDMEDLYKYILDRGGKLEVNKNPSKEEIKRIKDSLIRQELFIQKIKEEYERKNPKLNKST